MHGPTSLMCSGDLLDRSGDGARRCRSNARVKDRNDDVASIDELLVDDRLCIRTEFRNSVSLPSDGHQNHPCPERSGCVPIVDGLFDCGALRGGVAWGRDEDAHDKCWEGHDRTLLALAIDHAPSAMPSW